MSRLISIIGDGNVRRNMTGLNVASREAMKSAQVIDYAAPTSFDICRVINFVAVFITRWRARVEK